jgi:hypothetical protein
MAEQLPIGLPGIGVVGLDPTPEQLATIITLDLAAAYPGLSAELRDALYESLGTPTTMRDVAFVPGSEWATVVADTLVAGLPILSISRAKLQSFRRVCRLRCGLTPGDAPSAAPQLSVAGSGAPSASSANAPGGGRSIRLSHIIDPSLDAVLVSLASTDIRKMLSSYSALRGDAPSEEIEPTSDQISAVHQLLACDAVPYADFAVWGPYGKRLVAKLIYVAFVAGPDGQWQRRELPGPASFDVWWLSWRVLRTVYLLLGTADVEHLDNYAEYIRSLHARYGPEVWFIAYTADIRMRSERFERLRWLAESTHAAGPASSRFETARPWNEVFRLARHDRGWWDENFRDPAILYMQRSISAAVSVSDGTIHPSLGREVSRPGAEGGKQPAKQQERTAKRPREPDRNASDFARKNSTGEFTHNRKGHKLCSAYQSDSCKAACPASECHQCCKCLSTHPGSKCSGGGAAARSGSEGASRGRGRRGKGK